MKNLLTEAIPQETIFVDCFSTIILRNIKKNDVFKNWAKELENKCKIKWQIIYRAYKRVNFWLCFKKIFTKFILQEKIDVVLKKMFKKLKKFNKDLNFDEFIMLAKDIYVEKEKDCHFVNKNFVNFLKEQKKLGKKIYVVSDFYCPASDIDFWLKSLGINDIFDKVFSSYDFEKEKSTRGLYKYLIKNLNTKAKNILMIGDNFWSDFLMAKSCGLKAKCINNKREYSNEK